MHHERVNSNGGIRPRLVSGAGQTICVAVSGPGPVDYAEVVGGQFDCPAGQPAIVALSTVKIEEGLVVCYQGKGSSCKIAMELGDAEHHGQQFSIGAAVLLLRWRAGFAGICYHMHSVIRPQLFQHSGNASSAEVCVQRVRFVWLGKGDDRFFT